MICKSCGKNLPDESGFCPYCMTKFTKEQEVHNKKGNKRLVSIVAVLLAFIFVVTATVGVAFGKIFNRSEKETTENIEMPSTTEEVPSMLQTVSQSHSATKNANQAATTKNSTETTKEVTTTTTRNTNDSEAVLNAYVKQMLETLDLVWYYIYDMDNNGMYELIIMSGTFEGDFKFHFYTYRDGRIEYIDSVSARYSSLYVPLSGKGILKVYARQEWITITEITLNDRTFSTKKLFDTEIGYSEDYWDYVNDYASDHLIGCDTYDPKYAEYIFRYGYAKGSEKWATEHPYE